MTQHREPILLDVGLKHMVAGIRKLERILDGKPGVAFKSEEYMNLYTYVRHRMHWLDRLP
jgi:cullin 1